ncbi:MAG: hypothetical protein LBF97_05585 [Elusimicrobiota bacterium]|jgi:hypothetical protein|nr:hypothetical protein [Elusimicrobiota bacterium]
MLQVIKQRKYIEDFCKFVSSFLITEDATIDEINLVEANLDILKKRIQDIKGKTNVKGTLSGKKFFDDDDDDREATWGYVGPGEKIFKG